MFGFDEGRDAHQQVYSEGYQEGYNDPEPKEREGKFSHELIAGAASFEAMKLFEDRQRKEGKTVSHSFAKELLAGIAGGEVDKLAETKGMDEYDRERAKHRAKQNTEDMYEQHYVQNQGADQYDPNRYQQHSHFNNSGGGRREGGYDEGNQGYGGGGDRY